MEEDYLCRSMQAAVEALTVLPGVGRKTALRMTLHLLKADPAHADALGQALLRLRADTRLCERCFNLADGPLCRICTDDRRDAGLVCVVADVRDLIALEKSHSFRGVYHVLGGLINPLGGVGPYDLTADALAARAAQPDVREIILALAATPEGETTAFYLARRLAQAAPHVRVSALARGVPIGAELEYADEMTLARALSQRIAYALPQADDA